MFVCIIIYLAQDIFLFNFIRYAKYFFKNPLILSAFIRNKL